jgi:hypothetical protein
MRSTLLALVLTACAHQPEYSGKVTIQSSELIAIDPDVRVVADSDKPMFHVVGSFWMFHDANWYRAETVHGPWVREPKPPWQVRKIDQPYAYTRYRASHPRDQAAMKQETPSQDLATKRNRMFEF